MKRRNAFKILAGIAVGSPVAIDAISRSDSIVRTTNRYWNYQPGKSIQFIDEHGFKNETWLGSGSIRFGYFQGGKPVIIKEIGQTWKL